MGSVNNVYGKIKKERERAAKLNTATTTRGPYRLVKHTPAI